VRRASRVTLSPKESGLLRELIADAATPARIRRRAFILLEAAQGKSNREVAARLRTDVATVSLWRHRFETHGLEGGLRDAPRPGRSGARSSAVSERVLHATYNIAPTRGQRWTTRSLGRYLGLNHMAVQRIWRARGVRPREILGAASLYAHPPRSPFVELLGVFVRPPTRAAMFGVANGAAGLDKPPEPFRVPFPPTLSGGALIRPSLSAKDDLTAILAEVQTSVSTSVAPGIRDLLILLRDLEERTPPSTQVHIISESMGVPDQTRLANWLGGHPRFFLHRVAGGQPWWVGVRSFLEQWEPRSLHRSSLQGVPSFALAAVRHASLTPGNSQGLVWSISGGFASTASPKMGRIVVTDLSNADNAVRSPPERWELPSTRPSVREKPLLQNVSG
jgi:transposase